VILLWNFPNVVKIFFLQEALQSHLYEFKNEIYTLSKIEHLNLVRLYEYLEHGNQKLIVVEYVANGNLREHLDGKFCSMTHLLHVEGILYQHGLMQCIYNCRCYSICSVL
jgi:serine/threonine protein kinase